MTVLTALQSAATRLLGRKPSVFFGATAQFEIELCDMVNEVATDIAQYQDWQALTKTHTVNGDGATGQFSLPDDYSRMLINSDMQNSSNWLWGYFGFTDINNFLLSEQIGFTPWPGGWIIFGDELRFSPPPMNATQAQFPYISKNWARDVGGVTKPAFDNDADEFLLPERLLTLGVIWRWRENKGYAGSEADMANFTKALDEYGVKDRGSQVLRWGGTRRMSSVSIPYMGVAF